MLYCKADNHSDKYALECLYQAFLVQALLSPGDNERFCWNRTVNNHDGIGRNIPLDLCVEHSNNYIKQAIKNLGPNITEQAVARICSAEITARAIIDNMDHELHKILSSGRHTLQSTERDLEELVKRVIQTNVF